MSLDIVNLSKRFEEEWVLRDVNLSIPAGKILGICGSSASGKSTLLKIIAGVTRPSSGGFRFDETLENTPLLPARDVRLLSYDPEKSLWRMVVRSASRSHGEAIMQAVDQALLSDAKILLLDDPFSSLDAIRRASCFGKIRKWVSEGDRYAIFASTDFLQLAQIADDIAILANETVKQVGTPPEIYGHPLSVDAAVLSGETNIIVARRVSASNIKLPEFQTIDGGHRILTGSIVKQQLGPINQDVTLAIRPEQISISMGASFPEDNLIKARVVRTMFCGATSSITFDAGGLELKARVFKLVGLKIGEEFMLSLPPERISILTN